VSCLKSSCIRWGCASTYWTTTRANCDALEASGGQNCRFAGSSGPTATSPCTTPEQKCAIPYSCGCAFGRPSAISDPTGRQRSEKKGPLAGASGPSLGRKRPRRAAVTRQRYRTATRCPRTAQNTSRKSKQVDVLISTDFHSQLSGSRDPK
jgi:hypothetical protein